MSCCDRFVFTESNDEFKMWQGLVGAHYTPYVDEDGYLSWTNNGGLANPPTVNIKGTPGTGLAIKGIVESVEDLPDSANSGDVYLVGTEPPYDGYLYVNDAWSYIGVVGVGKDGRGISSIVKTGSSGLVDTYTIIYTDETSPTTFTVTNGADGRNGQDGQDGAPGSPGAPGVGVPTGGTAGQVLVKASGSDYDTEWVDQSGGGGTPGTAIPLMDGTADAGVAAAFAREDHRHPVDTSRASAADVADLNAALDELANIKVVRYDEGQTLTAAQKIQVLSNIFGVTNNAGFHNSVFRGKYLGSSFTTEQHNAISNGTFDDLFIGDYWTIGGIDYVICHFDYYYGCSDVNIGYHHIVVMPRGVMTGLSVSKTSSETTDGHYQWNTSNSTSGGYIGSRMRTVVMPACDAKVKAAFGSSYVKVISELYPNAHSTSTGRATGWAWTSTDLACDLCNETMVYGHQVWSIGNDGNPGYEVGMDKEQLSIFALYPQFANISAYWWLRSVASASYVAYVTSDGYAASYGASTALGVRPRFLLS